MIYLCRKCKSSFRTVKTNILAIVRCVNCGSIDTELKIVESKNRVVDENVVDKKQVAPAQQVAPVQQVIPAQNMSGRFVCIDCTAKFEFDVSMKRTPFCPKCKSVNVVSVSPVAAVAVYANDEKPLSLREQKRIKFIQRNWRQYVELETYLKAFDGIARRVSLPEELINEQKLFIKKCLNKLDELHKEKLQKYDKGE